MAASKGPGRTGEDPVASKLDLEDVKFRRLFVGSLDRDWDESVVEAYFGSLGDIEVCNECQKKNVVIYKNYL